MTVRQATSWWRLTVCLIGLLTAIATWGAPAPTRSQTESEHYPTKQVTIHRSEVVLTEERVPVLRIIPTTKKLLSGEEDRSGHIRRLVEAAGAAETSPHCQGTEWRMIVIGPELLWLADHKVTLRHFKREKQSLQLEIEVDRAGNYFSDESWTPLVETPLPLLDPGEYTLETRWSFVGAGDPRKPIDQSMRFTVSRRD